MVLSSIDVGSAFSSAASESLLLSSLEMLEFSVDVGNASFRKSFVSPDSVEVFSIAGRRSSFVEGVASAVELLPASIVESTTLVSAA